MIRKWLFDSSQDFEVPEVKQPQDMDDEERATLAKLAQAEYEGAVAARTVFIQESAHAARWLYASLLLINGGGAVAIIQIAGLTAETRNLAAACFVAGITLALWTASSVGSQMGDLISKTSEQAGYWLTVTVDHLRSTEIETDWQRFVRKVERRTIIPQILGYLSAVAFLAGCGIAAFA